MHYLYVIITLGYLALCLLNAGISTQKKLLWRGGQAGFWLVALASAVLTPPLVFLLMLFVPNRLRATSSPGKTDPSAR